MTSKIIILGDVNGHLHEAFKKLATAHAKNNFTFAIAAGNLFSEDGETVDALLANKIAIPLPTYFTIGTSPLPQRIIDKLQTDEDICENLHFLGKCSTTKTLEGLRIVALGGLPDPSVTTGLSQDKFTPFHTTGDAKSLYGSHSADILLTAAWPASIRNGSNKPIPEGITPPEGYDHISDLCMTLKPRYHFSTTPDFFFEREPFFHRASTDTPDFKPLTRFLSLSAHGNAAKAKALYAFQLTTKVDESQPLPVGTTIAPFSLSKIGDRKRRPTLEPEPYSRYGGGNHDRRDNKRGRGRRGDRQPPPGPGECFFCLANPTLATHLITSIGEDSYVTVAKGPLTTSDTFKAFGLDFPAHALIIPLTHSPTLASIPEEDNSRVKTFKEMKKYKEALQSMVAEKSNNKLGSVTYEISLHRGVHTHWQFLPIPADMLAKNLVEAALHVEAQNENYPRFEVRDPGISENEGDFFRAWIWTPPNEDSEGSTKCVTLPIDDNIRFNLQFGRTTLAKLLGLEKRTQWRDCTQTAEEETKDSDMFKVAFKPYDFAALEDDENIQVEDVKMENGKSEDVKKENAVAENV